MHCMSVAMPLTFRDGPCACSQDNSELKRSIFTGDKYCEWSYQYLAGGGQGHVYSNLYRNSALKLAPVTSYECVSAWQVPSVPLREPHVSGTTWRQLHLGSSTSGPAVLQLVPHCLVTWSSLQ